MPLLSRRGQTLATSSPLPEYLREHFARSGRPDYVPLCVAENKLVSDLLLDRMKRCRDVPASVLGYDSMIGSAAFREQLSSFLSRAFLGRRFAPEQLAVLAGAGTVLETLFYVLADPGDAVLVPTPSYAGFWLDLETRDAISIVPVHGESCDDFRLTPEKLDRAFEASERPVKALLFTSPDNPLGRVYSADEIRAVVGWTRARGIHLVMDEVYALSVHGDRSFTSVASLGPLGSSVHVVWAFSKDFAASGLRAGVLVSENVDVMRAVDALAYWGCVSGDTQWLLGCMIGDAAWVDQFIAANRARLASAKAAVTAALRQHGIRHLEPEAGFFLLLDLREFLAEASFAAEHALLRRLLDETGVNLTPGAACRIAEPGFARLCFAAVPEDVAVHATLRIGDVLRARAVLA